MRAEICHLRDLIKIEESPIYKRVMYKGLETGEMALEHITDLKAEKNPLLHMEFLLLNSCGISNQ